MKEFFEFLATFPPHRVSIDEPHALFLFGLIASLKPQGVLEFGVGQGYSTRTILHALRYNGGGTLTAVDNFKDWGGRRPPHFDALEAEGVKLVASSEDEFVGRCGEAFDLVVSDADHANTHKWISKTLSAVRPGGFYLLHDARLPSGVAVEEHLRRAGMNPFVFDRSTKPGERCGRGWLCAFKGSPPPSV